MHGINDQHQQNGMEETTLGYQNCDTSQILIFGGYVKVRNVCIQALLLLGSIPF